MMSIKSQNQHEDSDRKLSELFQFKKQLDVPSSDFWRRFDYQLQEKLSVVSQPKISWVIWIAEKIISHSRYAVGTAVAAACCAVFLFSGKKNASGNFTLTRFEQFAIDEISSKNNWKDTTLTLENSKNHLANYISDQISTSVLKSSTKDLIF